MKKLISPIGNNKLKIGLFIDNYFPKIDGPTYVVDNYARCLSNVAEVIVFCPKALEKNYVEDLPYPTVRCNCTKVYGLDYALPRPNSDKDFKKILEESNLDLVHIHSPFAVGKIGMEYAKKHNIPVVCTLHSQYKQDFKKAVKMNWITNVLVKQIMKVVNNCDECWTVNAKSEEIYKSEYGLKPKMLITLNGTEIEPITDKKSACERINKMFGIEPNDKVLLFVGRINLIKNLEMLVKSLKEVEKSNINYKMLFVGTGPHEEKLKKLVKNLGLEKNVIFTGRLEDRDDVIRAYARADLFLFPSLYDTSSLSQIEASSQSTPTLFIRGSATSTTVTEDVNGFMSENTPEAYGKKIVQILSDEEYYNKVREGVYRDLYRSWSDAVQVVYDNYLRLLHKK